MTDIDPFIEKLANRLCELFNPPSITRFRWLKDPKVIIEKTVDYFIGEGMQKEELLIDMFRKDGECIIDGKKKEDGVFIEPFVDAYFIAPDTEDFKFKDQLKNFMDMYCDQSDFKNWLYFLSHLRQNLKEKKPRVKNKTF